MIRIALDQLPRAWHAVPVIIDGEEAELRVRYHLLAPAEAAEKSAERLRLARAFAADTTDDVFDILMERLSAAEITAIRRTLKARILEWDLCDTIGEPIIVTEQSIAQLLDNGLFFRPLYDGLIDASLGGRSKNA